MEIILMAFVAMAVGLVLIFIIGRGQPVHPAAGASLSPQNDLNWIRAEGPGGFGRLLANLFAEMGFVAERQSSGPGTVDLFLTNPKPLVGGRIYVRGLLTPPLGMVGADEVRWASDTARAEYAGKGVVVTLGAFDEAARAEAAGVNVDLVDGGELSRLLKQHLPQVWAQKKIGG